MTRLNQELLKVIGDRISAAPDRRLTFSDYMDLVLYHPEHGYYSSGKVEIGAKGDFFTSVS
jgi:SAM-dependent MidA family methyltransferase